jgi:hypothetical protein
VCVCVCCYLHTQPYPLVQELHTLYSAHWSLTVGGPLTGGGVIILAYQKEMVLMLIKSGFDCRVTVLLSE